MSPIDLLFWLLVGHALCDFPLQGDFIAVRKSKHMRGDYGLTPNDMWAWCLSWHALIHAGAVVFITGQPLYGAAEYVLHWLIDYFKCEEYFDFGVDQALHVACKAGYVLVLSI